MKFSLKAKILTAFLCVGLIPLVTVGVYSYQKSSEAITSEALAKLESIRLLKAKAVERYFGLIQAQALTLAHNEGTIKAFEAINESFQNYIPDNSITPEEINSQKERLSKFYSDEFSKEYQKQNEGKTINEKELFNSLTQDQLAIQADYISGNSNPLGSKHLLNKAGRKGRYDFLHSIHHPNFVEYLQKFEFYDIFLIDGKTGNIVYSVYKELDFATSLKNGPYSGSGLGKVFRKAMDATDQNTVVMEDYEVYRPSYDGPASFIATPIFINGEKKGVIAFQISFDKINSITLEKTGSEKTLEAFLVGSDYLMRSDAVADKENRNVRASFRYPEKGSSKTDSVIKALKGENGSLIGQDYFGISTLESFGPLDVIGNRWAILTYYRTEEALAPVIALRNAFVVTGLIFITLISIFAIWFDRSVVSGLINSISKVAEGLKTETTKLRDVAGVSSELASKLSEATTEQAASLQETVASIDEISAMVRRNSDSATTSSQKSEHSNMIATKGKEKAGQMMDSIAAIAEGNEEIINQIEASNREFSEIVKVIQDISLKTQVINDIVFQTKLLSFNASVEAARAGENGKGFAVVAEEVGNLASMSGKAASEITEMVTNSVRKVVDIVENSKVLMDQSIRKSKEKIEVGTITSRECMKALDEIHENVSSVNEMIREISTASKEQSSGVQEINKAMSEMDQVTQSNTLIAQDSSQTAKELQSQAERLNVLVVELSRTLGHDLSREGMSESRNRTDNVVSMRPQFEDV
jgi:methyl-accepting chemotaxis protein